MISNEIQTQGGKKEVITDKIVRDYFMRFNGDVIMEQQSSSSPSIDKLLRNASKKGCGKDILRQIIGIKSIIYISCNPIALSKDLQFLKNDYIIEEIIPYDMFPNTNQVETLVKLKFKGEQ